MNTATLRETQAIVAAGAQAVVSGQGLLLIALSRLRPSKKRNVRASAPLQSIPELAASIARVGLLQNLVVVPDPDGEHYEVVAGKRRLAALKLLVKRRKLLSDHEVPCLPVPEEAGRTASLSENVQRVQMHPADQFEAFAALVAEGRPVEDIAADFGVTPLVVQRRLKLANVSPRLLADYRADTVTLEQLMALAITDAHAAQEAAFYGSPAWQRNPQALRDHLTHEDIEAARDPLARFVGIDAYRAAGGAIRRDLFSEDDEGIYFTDFGLLDQLARERLAAVAEQVRGEGWSWVDVAPRATCAELHAFQRAPRARREPNKAEAKRLAKLEAQQTELQDQLDAEDAELSEEQMQAMQENLDRLGNELDAIEQSLVTYAPEVLALAGAVVSLDHAGGVLVQRGLLRPEQAKALRAQERGEVGGVPRVEEAGAPAGAKRGMSERLARRLSAHRTVALQAEVARHPNVALAALVHQLALDVLVGGYYGQTCVVNVSAKPRHGLAADAPDVEESPAAKGLDEVCEAWIKRLPQAPDALLAELLALPQQELLSLLAVCVARTVDATTSREEVPACQLAQAVGLDMHAWWKPTAAGYFEHVSKAQVIEAVQSFAADQVQRIGMLKKHELAAEAERLAAGSSWLPAMLRGPEPQVAEV
jgi:ParB family chromosome partitioning protein